MKTQLLPMLHTKSGHLDKDLLFDVSVKYLENLIQLEDTEIEFITRFFKGDFRPELLFNKEISDHLKEHPVVQRTLSMIK